MILSIIKNWKLILAGLGLLVFVALGSYLKGTYDGADHQVAQETKQRIEDVGKARKIENEVNKLSPAGVDDGLTRWLRD